MPGGLLTIYAHPDDETLGAAGRWRTTSTRGIPVTMVCATRGEVGEIAPGTGATPETLGRVPGAGAARRLRHPGRRRTCGSWTTAIPAWQARRRTMTRAACTRRRPSSVVEQLVRIIRERAAGRHRPPGTPAAATATRTTSPSTTTRRRPTTRRPTRRAIPQLGAPHRVRALYYSVIPIEEFGKMREELAARGIDLGAPRRRRRGVRRPAARAGRTAASTSAPSSSGSWRPCAPTRRRLDESGIFGGLPDDLARRLFGNEFYHRADPPLADGVMLRRPARQPCLRPSARPLRPARRTGSSRSIATASSPRGCVAGARASDSRRSVFAAFGAAAAQVPRPRSATVRATTRSTALRLSRISIERVA